MFRDEKEIVITLIFRRLMVLGMIVALVVASMFSYIGVIFAFIASSQDFPLVRAVTSIEFEISNLKITPAEVEPLEEITISVTVSNIGNENSSYTVTVVVDQEVMDKKSMTLSGGTSTSVNFTIFARSRFGIHTVNVEDLTGIYTVVSPPPSNQFPWFWVVAIVIISAVVLYIVWKRTS